MSTPAAAPQPQKVLVTGAASSSISTFFTKLAALQAKHAFSLVLAMDLFSGTPNDSLDLAELLAGTITVPVQVYVSVGGGELPEKIREKIRNGEEVCRNVTMLGKSGILTLASGLKLGTFGGAYDPTIFSLPAEELDALPDSLDTSTFKPSDVTSFIASLTPPPSQSSLPSPPLPPPDILLTHAYPAALPLLSSKPLPPTNASRELDELAQRAHAKYHFISGAGVFWEREPFSWPREVGGGVCRAISLGELGNKTKERWFYAFSITPKAAPPATAPTNATPSPFSVAPPSAGAGRGMKRPAGSLDDGVNEYGVPNYIFGGQGGQGDRGKKGKGGPPPDHYTCNICQQKGHWIQECPEKAERDAARDAARANRGEPRRPIQPDECWFCLSNPKVTKHLIASIGSETYLTLPKGQLLPTHPPSKVSPVPGGGHVLIIPIAHYPTLLSVPADLAVPIISEIEKYKSALRDCYKEYGAQMLSFEVGRLSGKGGHAHVQILPIVDSLADKAEEVFRAEGEKHGITFEEEGEAALKKSGVSDNYFRVDLPSGKTLVHVIKPGVPFSLQFGRATVATLLGIPERTDWKACARSDQEEKADCVAFKKVFKKFDPSE
ncbi:hypothetical protein MNV49_007962 [Pseudohyphozyma bogoriensis]|nr:hypothetical protein MNV49_007962 [Pseudohyphozyma bogoriensis]